MNQDIALAIRNAADWYFDPCGDRAADMFIEFWHDSDDFVQGQHRAFTQAYHVLQGLADFYEGVHNA